MRSLVPYVDIMKISDEETKLLTDKESPEEATERVCTVWQRGGKPLCREERRDPCNAGTCTG